MAEQLNIFVENKPGRLSKITKVLADASINMRAIVIADRETFGIVKILVDNPLKACQALTSAGYACALKKVLAIVIEDQPGGLHNLTTMLSDSDINVLDAYGFVVESRKAAVLCVEVKEYEAAKKIVEGKGLRILNDSELYDL